MRLINAFGDKADHTVLAARGGPPAARSSIDRAVTAEFPGDSPRLDGLPGLVSLFRLSRYMRRFDLVLSYGWSALNLVMARHLFGGPPLIHHQDDAGNANGALGALCRRMALSSVFRLVVGSRAVERLARTEWGLPAEKVELIVHGIDVGRFSGPAVEGAIPGLARQPGEVVIGTVAELQPENNLLHLVRAFAAMQVRVARLVLVGTGPETERIVAEARRCRVAERLLMPGALPDPARFLSCFDIFASAAAGETLPAALLQAMAAGLPIAASVAGHVPAVVSPDNLPLIVAPDDEAALTAALDTLSERSDLRQSIGRANRETARCDFDEKAMLVRYARLYGDAIGAPQTFLAALA